ncbi:MAG: class I SAM-dependent methyltransferase [Gammaproteobacteria bacterium]|nr:class I SAM-dependent methyltransferase [Gammaproteobacteria bacterium]
MNGRFGTSNTESPCIYLATSDQQGFDLADRLELQVRELSDAPKDWYLTCKNGKLTLDHPTEPSFQLSEQVIRSRIEDAFRSDLAQACGYYPGKTVLDCYGGWGIDGLILAAAGCNVSMTEIHPVLCVFARDLAYQFNLKMNVICDDVKQFLHASDDRFDTIYLDPMFPTHPTTAKPQRRMQILEQIAVPTQDLDTIFDLALRRANDRVVIKNRKNQRLLDQQADWKIKRRSVRFDVYLALNRPGFQE